MGFWSELWEAIKKVWNFLKRVTVKILNFFNNIVNWFKNPETLAEIRKDLNNLPVAVKQNLANGKVTVITGIFNKATGELSVKHTIVYDAEKLDEETAKRFGDKDLIILK